MKGSSKKKQKTTKGFQEKSFNDGVRKKKLKPIPRLKYKRFEQDDEK